MKSKWDARFLELAKHVSSWSKDPSTKCGAVIVDTDRRVISLGFNGFPINTSDATELYVDREEKYRRVIHAEQNAMAFSYRDIRGCSIYVWPMPPCSQCSAMIIQRGIRRVITVRPTDEQVNRWGDGFLSSESMLRDAGVCVEFMEIQND